MPWRAHLAAVTLAVALAAPHTISAEQGTATAPKLDESERTEDAAPASNAEAALPLPPTITICQDVAAQQCWSEYGAGACASATHADARVFRRVANNAAPGDALTACWEALRAPPKP